MKNIVSILFAVCFLFVGSFAFAAAPATKSDTTPAKSEDTVKYPSFNELKAKIKALMKNKELTSLTVTYKSMTLNNPIIKVTFLGGVSPIYHPAISKTAPFSEVMISDVKTISGPPIDLLQKRVYIALGERRPATIATTLAHINTEMIVTDTPEVVFSFYKNWPEWTSFATYVIILDITGE